MIYLLLLDKMVVLKEDMGILANLVRRFGHWKLPELQLSPHQWQSDDLVAPRMPRLAVKGGGPDPLAMPSCLYIGSPAPLLAALDYLSMVAMMLMPSS
jgi:hypothetical protein